jgi:hypothetical protein
MYFNNVNKSLTLFIINKGKIVWSYFVELVFDLVLRYSQQISDKYGHPTGNADWNCEERDRRED